MGERRLRDGKKKRAPKGTESGPVMFDVGNRRTRLPALEELGRLRFIVTENSVQFRIDWDGKTVRWFCGRHLTRDSVIRQAAPEFWEAFYRPEQETRRETYEKGRKAAGISAIVQAWKGSSAWDETIERAGRVFQVEDVMRL